MDTSQDVPKHRRGDTPASVYASARGARWDSRYKHLCFAARTLATLLESITTTPLIKLSLIAEREHPRRN
jgi:hypothetical protein